MAKEAPKTEKNDPIAILTAAFNESVIGQEESNEEVAKHVVSSLGKETDGAPKGVFLFVGPDGVGKTRMAQTLAEIMKPPGAQTEDHFINLRKKTVPDSIEAGGVLFAPDIHNLPADRLQLYHNIAQGNIHLTRNEDKSKNNNGEGDTSKTDKDKKSGKLDLGKTFFVFTSEAGQEKMRQAHLGVEHPGFGHKPAPETSSQQNLRIGKKALNDPYRYGVFDNLNADSLISERNARANELKEVGKSPDILPVGLGFLTPEARAEIASRIIKEQTAGKVEPGKKLVERAVLTGTSDRTGAHELPQTVRKLVTTDYRANVAAGKINPEERVAGRVNNKDQVTFGKVPEARSKSKI